MLWYMFAIYLILNISKPLGKCHWLDSIGKVGTGGLMPTVWTTPWLASSLATLPKYSRFLYFLSKCFGAAFSVECWMLSMMLLVQTANSYFSVIV